MRMLLGAACLFAVSLFGQKPLVEGNPASTVRVVVYEDLQCPDCAAFRKMMDADLLPKYKATVAGIASRLAGRNIHVEADGTGADTVDEDAPSAVYKAADQITDFGGVQSALHVEVYQLSTRPVGATGDGKGFADRLRGLLADRYRIVVAAEGAGSAQRLHGLLLDHELDFRMVLDDPEPDFSGPGGYITVAPLHAGVELVSSYRNFLIFMAVAAEARRQRENFRGEFCQCKRGTGQIAFFRKSHARGRHFSGFKTGAFGQQRD